VNLCDPRQQALVYGLPATSGVVPAVSPVATGFRLFSGMTVAESMRSADDPDPSWRRTKGIDVKQLVASNVNSCVSPQNSRVCQPNPRPTPPPPRPWWQVWRRP
jgi:hypothetical protein